MKRLHSKLAYVAVSLAGLIALGPGALAPAAESRPNIIVFLSDDLGWGELGFQGNKEIPTPHQDSIAKNGIRFTQGYVSGPYCSPTRAGLMTGRYQTRFGHEFNGGGGAGGNDFGLPLTEKTIADRLKALGYATCAIGKWHLGAPPKFIATARGFDEFYGTVANTPFFNPPNFIDTRVGTQVQPVKDENFYTTDAYAARAVDWIEKNRERPFFLYFPFNAQHAPLQATQKYLDRVASIQDEKRRTFAAMMVAMDDAIGRVLETLRKYKLEENTLIFYHADNGGPTQQTTSNNGPLRGFKATTSDGGVRVPFAVQWKGRLPAGKTYEHPIIQLDILPTAIAAAGGKVDPAWKLEGVNLLPYLEGKKSGADRPHEALYWRFGPQWAIRQGDWKLVASRIDGNVPRLIDFTNDIGEATDLSAKHPDKVAELTAAWKKWDEQNIAPLWVPANQPSATGATETTTKKAKKKKKTEK